MPQPMMVYLGEGAAHPRVQALSQLLWQPACESEYSVHQGADMSVGSRQARSSAVVDLTIIVLVSVAAFALSVHYGLVDRILAWAHQHEIRHLDELAILIGVLALGLASFTLRKWTDLRHEMVRRAETEAAKELVEQELRYNVARLEILHQVEQATLAAESSDQIAAAALDGLRNLLGSEIRANVVLLDGGSEYATILASSVPSDPLFPVGSRVPEEDFQAIWSLRENGRVRIGDLADARPSQQILEHLTASGIRSLLFAPMQVQDELLGTLNLGAKSAYAFEPQHEPIVGEVAEALALAIHHARLSAEVRLARERLAKLSGRLIETQEVERQRISRELHDQIGQSLVAVKLQLQSMPAMRERDLLVARVRESIALVERTVRQVRDLSLELRPSLLDDLGLVATLRWYVDRQARWAGVTSRFVSNPAEVIVPSEVEVVAFRIVQEALTNALHHAQASEVCVCLEKRDGELDLRVQDDGRGFDVGTLVRNGDVAKSLGILGMQERAQLAGGRLEIESAPGQGTLVVARFPLVAEGPGDGLRVSGEAIR
jgi:signal transduction histidine kinase